MEAKVTGLDQRWLEIQPSLAGDRPPEKHMSEPTTRTIALSVLQRRERHSAISAGVILPARGWRRPVARRSV